MILTQRAGQTALKDLLESDIINIEKLKQYIQKNSIVAEFKPLCWKFLLDIKSPYRTTRRYVDQANCDIYKRFHSTLITCKIIQNTTPISQQFLSMYLLDTHAIKLPLTSIVNKILKKLEISSMPFLFRKNMNRFYRLQILFVHFLIMIMNNE